MHNLLKHRLVIILAATWRRRYLIALPIVLMPFLAAALSLALPKKYETYTTILIQEAASNNPFLEDLTIATNLKKRMGSINALLHSHHMLNDVAKKMDLIDEEMPLRVRRQRIAKLSNSLRASLLGDELIKIAYSSNDPEGMAEILKLVSMHFVERVIAPQRSSIYSSEAFLKRELEERKSNLSETEAKLAAYKSSHANELPELHSSNVNRLGLLRAELSNSRRELLSAEASQESLKLKLSRTKPVVGRIEESIVQAMSELALLRSRYTDQHSEVQGLLRSIENLQSQRKKHLLDAEKDPTLNMQNVDLDRLWNRLSSMENDGDRRQPLLISQIEDLQKVNNLVQSLGREVLSLEREVTSMNARVDAYGGNQQHLNELLRELEVSRNIYDDLAERYQKSRVTGALGRWEEKERVKLIDPPTRPLGPSNPSLLIFIICGLLGGFAMGSGLAFCSELLDTSIRRRAQLEALLGVAVITRIPPLHMPPYKMPTH